MSEEKRNDAPSSTGADKDKSAASASTPNKTTGKSSTPAGSASASGKASAPATDTGSTNKAASKAASGGKKSAGSAKPDTAGSDKPGANTASTNTASAAKNPAQTSAVSKPADKTTSAGSSKPASASTSKPGAAGSGAAASSGAASTSTNTGGGARTATGGSAGTPHRPTPTGSSSGGNGGGTSKIIAIVAGVIAIIALVLSGWLFARGQDRLASLDSRLNTVEKGMQSNVQEVVMPRLKRFDSRLQSVSGDVEQQAQTLSSLQESLKQAQARSADLSDRIAGTNNRWDLNQIEALLQAANQRLQLYDDPEGARQALELASDVIARKSDPRLFDLRSEIVNEIAALEALPDPDVEGMSLALAAMIERVPELPLASNVPGQYAGEDGQSSQASAEQGSDDSGMSMEEFQAQFSQGWDHFVDSVGEALSGMLTIRRADGTQRALLPPDQAFFLNQNLQLELRSARLALLERDTQNYRDSLASARQWLEDYYDTSAAPVSSMQERIGQMSNVKLDWDAPDISASLTQLREMMAQRGASAGNGDSNADDANENANGGGSEAGQDGQ
jgi:uroporphyrin-3 C-methyltransferase